MKKPALKKKELNSHDLIPEWGLDLPLWGLDLPDWSFDLPDWNTIPIILKHYPIENYIKHNSSNQNSLKKQKIILSNS